MGVFLQTALFPGCEESDARAAVEKAAQNPAFQINLKACRYARSYEGVQVLIEGDCLGFDTLAKALSDFSENPVMLLYVYDGDYWGYDFYAGREEDHFSARPGALGPISPAEKQRLSGNPKALAGWFPTWDMERIGRYLVHWSDLDEAALEETACSGDQFPYGDCWQMADFMDRLGFPWAFDGLSKALVLSPVSRFPALGEILEQNLPPLPGDGPPASPILDRLPTALSPEYIRNLLKEEGVRDFGFERKTPPEIVEAVQTHRWTVGIPESDLLCRRLAVLAAFCVVWLGKDGWGFLSQATYEPLYGSYEKPTDVCLLRARAALADYSKHHRAMKDLKRLVELDPANRELYQAELRRWDSEERNWEKRASPRHEAMMREFAEKKRQEEEWEAKRLQLILEKRRKSAGRAKRPK